MAGRIPAQAAHKNTAGAVAILQLQFIALFTFESVINGMSFVSKEDIMASLKSLTLTTLLQIQADPIMDRRNRTIAHLEEQKRLLQDPSYTRTVKVWTEKDGERQRVEREQRVFPWWRNLPNGSAVLTVRVAQKPIEFEKGKAGIAVASADKLPSVIDTLISAIRNGELDELLAQASKAVPSKKKKAA